MRSRPVEGGNILLDRAVKVTLVQEENVIQVFAAYAPQKAFTDDTGFGRANGGAKDLDSTGSTLEFGAIIPVVVAN
jgi:hypothetical protein